MSITPVTDTLTQPAELNLQELLDVLQRRKGTFIQVFLMVLAAGIVAASLGKPVYVTVAKVLVPSGSPSVSLIDSNNPVAALMAASQPYSLSTQLEALQGGDAVQKAEKELRIVPRPEVIPPSVRFEALPDANIIQVTVEGGDPREIAALADRIVDRYKDEADGKENYGIKRTKEFVREELGRQEKKLGEAEQNLAQYRQKHNIAQRSSERDTRAGEYAALLARVIETESNLTATKAQLASLQNQLAKEPRMLVEETSKDNPRVAKLQDKLDDLKLQRLELLREYRPTSRAVQDLDRLRERLQQQLAAEPAEIRSHTRTPNPARATLKSRLDELTATLHGYEENSNAARAQLQARKPTLENQDLWEADLAKLTHDRDTIQTACNNLADHLRELEIRERAKLTPPTQIIERAVVPTSPIRPRKATNMGLSAILALLLAAGTVLLQEYLDDRINAPEEVERLAGLPTLAHVPMMAPDRPRVLSELPAKSPVAESYRGLRSSIGFAGLDAPIRRLQVTSASKGDGKSTTSANLAAAMARDGKTVVLIDADLRSPTLHRLLEAPASPGLSEVLAGMNSLDEALQRTEIEGLLLLPAGSVPPNPAELLGSPAFDRLLEELAPRADVVLFDTPPCMPVSDPLIVAARMDAVVLVLKVGQTRKGAIKQTVELLARARARIVGTVFNQVEPHRRGYYYYRQYNYYGDGYYGDTPAVQERPARNGKSPKPALETREVVSASPQSPEDES